MGPGCSGFPLACGPREVLTVTVYLEEVHWAWGRHSKKLRKRGIMAVTGRWSKEAGARLQGSRSLDSSKLQALGVTPIPGGGRLYCFSAAFGPGGAPVVRGFYRESSAPELLMVPTSNLNRAIECWTSRPGTTDTASRQPK